MNSVSEHPSPENSEKYFDDQTGYFQTLPLSTNLSLVTPIFKKKQEEQWIISVFLKSFLKLYKTLPLVDE